MELFVFACLAVIWSAVVTCIVVWLIRRQNDIELLTNHAHEIAEQAGLAAIAANPSRVDQLAGSLDNHLQEHAAREMYRTGILNAPPNLAGPISPPQDHNHG